MKEKINIAEILRDKPVNTKLYSPLFSEVFFSHVSGGGIAVEHNVGTSLFFISGKFYDYDGAEPLLFPSKEMRDWSKFAWKKGDILVNKDAEVHIIFDGFKDDTYKTFHGHYYLWEEEGSIVNFEENEDYMQTSEFYKANKEEAQTYINTIEERLGGKLNMETLKIEKAQPEFKDGDIITFKDRIIIIYNNSIEKYPNRTEIYYHACLKEGELTVNEYLMSCGFGEGWYSSTEEEKRQLFSALEKEGKAWDAEKKQIVDLKPKCELKPFDRCIWKIRNCEGSIWRASFVSYVDEYGATPMDVSIDEDLVNLIILPYNDQTKLLVGTTDEWEGGEQ
jgi:hypothetical protein